MTFTRQCNIACEGIAKLSEMNPAARAERTGPRAGGGDAFLRLPPSLFFGVPTPATSRHAFNLKGNEQR